MIIRYSYAALTPRGSTTRIVISSFNEMTSFSVGVKLFERPRLGAQPTFKKLRLDLVGVVGTCPDMTDDLDSKCTALVQRLCLEAGRIIEDESPGDRASQVRRPNAVTLTCARQAGEDIAALIAAAEVVARRAGAEM